jgi:hypothetical protein
MHRFAVVSVVVGIVACGCAGSSRPPIASVDGTIVFRGKPVQHAKVVFLPQNVAGGSVCVGQTDDEGRFSKIVMVDTGKEGAVVGTYHVSVTEAWPQDMPVPVDDMGQEKSPPREKWPQKYRDSASGALKVEVVADKPNHFEFDLSK